MTITRRYQQLCRAGPPDERARRLWAAQEARSLGRGGVAAVARAVGVSESTVRRGLRELDRELDPGEELAIGRVRRPGAGRPRIAVRDPGLIEELERLIEPFGHAAEQSPLRWTCKSCAVLAAALRARNHAVADRTVLRLLRAAGYSPQANRQTRDGVRHPDRGGQFEYVSRTASAALSSGALVLSIEVRRPTTNGRGWAQVSITDETASLVTGTILAWWERLGRDRIPVSSSLMVTADWGGQNSERTRAWRSALQAVADHVGLELSVCHFPAGTTRWDGVAHRVLCLLGSGSAFSHEVAISVIGRPAAGAVPPTYVWIGNATEAAVSRRRAVAADVVPAGFGGDWNYRIRPAAPSGV